MTDHIDDVNQPDEELRDRLPHVEPPESLEARVTASLQQAGLVGAAPANQRMWSRPFFAIAAGLLLFMAGLGARNAWDSFRPAGTSHAQRFALLLYEGDSQPLVEDDVTAHRLWARDLAESGHEVSGEKLGRDGVELTSTADEAAATSVRDLKGFFVISATSEAEAEAIARSSPHFKHGGLVIVKKIDPT